MQRKPWKKKVGWFPRSVIDRLDLPNAGYRSDRSTWLLRDRKKPDARLSKMKWAPLLCARPHRTLLSYTSCFFSPDYRYTPRELNNLLNKKFRASVIHFTFRFLVSLDVSLNLINYGINIFILQRSNIVTAEGLVFVKVKTILGTFVIRWIINV